MKSINKFYLLFLLIPISIVAFFFLGTNFSEGKNTNEDNSFGLIDVEEEKSILEKEINVDVKGEVRKPGVYRMKENEIVMDAIKRAGGLKKSAYTKNINLSKTLSNEMVVYVFSNSEIKSLKKKNIDTNDIKTTTCKTEVIEVNNCPNIIDPVPTTSVDKNKPSDSSENDNSNKLININTATKEELMSISGIGESKAIAIISYRTQNKFNSIEDIKNVSGIGDSLYEKIKQYITV